MLRVENVCKTYPSGVRAVDDVSLALDRGVVGLIGHNGAGKTSLINMIATLMLPSSGRILFDGADIAADPDAIRRRLGFLPQSFNVQGNLTARDFLRYMAALKGVRNRARVGECLELVNLQDFGGRRLGEFSGGMRRRLGIAQALLNDPDILVVDEPTTGLDLEERRRFRALMAELGFGKLVILSTHIVSDVENIATGIVMISDGQLIAHATPQQILARARGHIWSALVETDHYHRLRKTVTILRAHQQAEGMQLRMAHPQAPCPGAEPVEPGLEDALMAHPRMTMEQPA
jgi:ABC-type multidrug transport system ATPase subunit